MPGGRSRIQFNSPRAERLVAAWNRGDAAFVLGQLSESVVLVARLPKMPSPADTLELRTKAVFAAGLAAYAGPLPRFTIVTAVEDPHSIGLVLADADGDLLAITIELNEEGTIERITSYRPDK